MPIRFQNVPDFPLNIRKDGGSYALRKLLGDFAAPTVVRCTENFEVLQGMKGLFSKGEKVVLKGKTFQVVHLTNESVMLEPVSLFLDSNLK